MAIENQHIVCSCHMPIDVTGFIPLDDVTCPRCGKVTTITPFRLREGAPPAMDETAPDEDGDDAGSGIGTRAVRATIPRGVTTRRLRFSKCELFMIHFAAEKGGVLGLSNAAVPILEFGGRCVCCDSPGAPDFTYDVVAPSNKELHYKVPICHECRAHTGESPADTVLMMLAVGCLAFLVAGLVATGSPLSLLFVLGILPWVGRIIRQSSEAAKVRGHGHHPEFELIATTPGRFTVVTENPRLARELPLRHPDTFIEAEDLLKKPSMP